MRRSSPAGHAKRPPTLSGGRAGLGLRIAEAWGHHTAARYDEVPGANHFTVNERLCDPTDPMVDRLVALCGRTVAAAQS